MSGKQPAAPQQRELEIMRVLFERRLKDRAIALSDSRWPGSGKMVDLAYEWGTLDPATRRERLSAIGPDEIARLREFAALNPDLDAAVTELDRRGVLPHLEAAAVDVAAASREARQTTSESSTTQPQTTPETPAASEPTPQAAAEIETETVGTPERPSYARPEPVAEVPTNRSTFQERNAARNAERAAERATEAMNVDMPDLDLGLPSTSEFLEEQAARREETTRSTEQAMERVRQRLDQSTQRAFDRGSAFTMPKLPDVARSPRPELHGARERADTAIRAVAPPRSLATEFETHIVASIRPSDPKPTDDELVALANELQVGFSEHRLTFGNRKEELGSLVSEYGRVSVRTGRLARAVSDPNLVVIRGRLTPQLADRLEAGFLDIPGTRASVKVHPKTRVLVIGD